MTHDLILLHRKGPQRFDFIESSAPYEPSQWFSFATCMRHIVLIDPEQFDSLSPRLRTEGDFPDEVHFGDDAYKFLLQVICGLHSPLVGETEVYGQFKNAVQAFEIPLSPWGYQLSRFFRALFEDAKRVRQAHLEDLGSQSYGSILRRELKALGQRSLEVHVVGAGHLAQEILPWIAKDGTELHIHCRNPKKAQEDLGAIAKSVRIHSLSTNERPSLENADALIIAAPVSASWVRDWMSASAADEDFDQSNGGIGLIADLRSDSKEDRIESFARVLPLDEFFARISSNQSLLEARKRAALAAIETCVRERSRHVENRPFGWEDVCA